MLFVKSDTTYCLDMLIYGKGARRKQFPRIIKKASIHLAATLPKPHTLGQMGKPRRGVDTSTFPPKPRVESSNLSAPAKNPPDFARNQTVLLLLRAVRGSPESSCRASKDQIVQSVTPVLNLSVWYSIKIASKPTPQSSDCGVTLWWVWWVPCDFLSQLEFVCDSIESGSILLDVVHLRDLRHRMSQ